MNGNQTPLMHIYNKFKEIDVFKYLFNMMSFSVMALLVEKMFKERK